MKRPETLCMPDAEVVLYRTFFEGEESDALFERLLIETKWRQDKIKCFGKEFSLPRLTAWCGDPGKSYTYSGISMNASGWTSTLLYIKRSIEVVANMTFNTVLLNLYRDGKDSVSWHSDDEPELGMNPVIGSVSFGEARRFQFKHVSRGDLGKVGIDLTHGSLLIMQGTTQHFWQHQLHKTSEHTKPRINLTFRLIH